MAQKQSRTGSTGPRHGVFPSRGIESVTSGPESLAQCTVLFILSRWSIGPVIGAWLTCGECLEADSWLSSCGVRQRARQRGCWSARRTSSWCPRGSCRRRWSSLAWGEPGTAPIARAPRCRCARAVASARPRTACACRSVARSACRCPWSAPGSAARRASCTARSLSQDCLLPRRPGADAGPDALVALGHRNSTLQQWVAARAWTVQFATFRCATR
jgi:hypothetical protein